MKKFLNFILVFLLSLVICSPVWSQDNAPSKVYDKNGSVIQNPNFDGPKPPTNQAAIVVLPGNGSTSGNGRAPQGSRLFINGRYMVSGNEMTASGFGATTVQSVGWRWNVPGFGPVAQDIGTTGTLKVFLKDTAAATGTITGAFIDTTGALQGYTKIIDGIISIPPGLGEINIDVPVGGPGTAPFTTTAGNGVLVIFVYKTTTTLALPLGAPTVFCTNLGGNIFTYQSQTTPGNAGASSTFRPETRFGNSPIAVCDVGPTANLAPAGTISSCPSPPTIAPKASVRNFGTAGQTGILVTYMITGPAGYSSTRTITSLAAGASATVTFDSTFVPSITGTYNVTIYTTLACDTSKGNDTLKTTFTISNSNFGGGAPANCNYFFANSTACANGAPNQPIFFWMDTTGSTSLVVNGVNALPTTFNGTLDDGHWLLGNILAAGDKFRYCGVDYDSFFVGTNGQIGLTETNNTAKLNSFSPLSIPAPAAAEPGLFPFWKDLNFTAGVVLENRISYKVIPGKLIITYDRAPEFGPTDATDYISFQIILDIVPGPTTDANIVFQYDASRTGATFLNKYFGFTLGAHTVGIQDETGTKGIQYRRVTGTGAAAVLVDGPLFTPPNPPAGSVAVAFGPNQNALPVELASFSSTINANNVTLNWSTATETNNSGFDLERSAVNGSWSTVGNVAGNGTTTTPMNYSFTDRNLASGKYNYRLKQIDFNGNFHYYNLSNEVNVGVPVKFALSQNYPNPFNPSTKIEYDLPFDSKVSIKLFDMSGKEVATLVNEVKTAGYYSVNFNASNLSSGVYFYRISADANGNNFLSTKKMLLVK